MGFGAEGIVVVMAWVYGLLAIVIAAVTVSVVVGLRSRRAVAWTPIVLVAVFGAWMTPQLANAHRALAVGFTLVALGIWFAWAWPSHNHEAALRVRPPWRPVRALAVSTGTFGLLISLPVFVLVALSNDWTYSSPKPSTVAKAVKKAVPKRPTRPVTPAPTAAELEARFGRQGSHDGLTWTALRALRHEGIRYVLVGTDDRSNAYKGDTPPRASLPILAIRPSNASPPPGIDPKRWSRGEVRLTEPIQGSNLSSLAFANFFIEEKHGPDWRMASFHEAAGWRFWAVGDLEVGTGQRFWVTIRDQPANPWD